MNEWLIELNLSIFFLYHSPKLGQISATTDFRFRLDLPSKSNQRINDVNFFVC